MTAFLASVANVAEALLAQAGGADILDCEDIGKGGFGAMAPADVASIAAAIAGKRPICASLAAPSLQAASLLTDIDALRDAGVDHVKIGLFPGANDENATRATIEALKAAAAGSKLIAVFFVDHAPDFTLLPLLADAGFFGAMLDTANKADGRLLDHCRFSDIAAFIAACRRLDLSSGLAGSLEEPDIPRLLALSPDSLGFRSALCAERNRREPIQQAALARVRRAIPAHPKAGDAQKNQHSDTESFRAAPGSPSPQAPSLPLPSEDAGAPDRIFLRDFLIEMEIGAYAHEQNRKQRVRFNVEADVVRPPRAADGFGDIVSYDVFVDTILQITQSGHVSFVETMAETIAETALRDPRILRVRVRIEKLDIVNGAVGVEILRKQPGVT